MTWIKIWYHIPFISLALQFCSAHEMLLISLWSILIILKSFLALSIVEIHVYFNIYAFEISFSKEHLKKLFREQHISESLWSLYFNEVFYL